jgi:hypothetical protein
MHSNCQSRTVSNHTTKLTSARRKQIWLSAAARKDTITGLANRNCVCRKTVRKARDKTLAAVDNAFSQKQSEVLFHLPVTKRWIESLVLGLMFITRASYRSIKTLINDLFDRSISLGKIHNIFRAAADEASKINNSIDLSDIDTLCADELFHHNKPILNAVDAYSYYCCTLSINDHRDGDTWGVHLLDAKEQGLNPRVMVSDQADGLVAAQNLVFPGIVHRYDNFHLSRMLMDLRRFYRNRFRSSITDRKDIERRIEHGLTVDPNALQDAVAIEQILKHVSTTIDQLISWLEHDILNKAGLPHHDREMLYDFILEEFRKLEKIESHRISSACVTLKNKKISSLNYVKELDARFTWIAQQHNIPVDCVWEMAQLQRCDYLGDTYAIRMLPLCKLLGDEFDDLEDDVLIALDSTERTSSAVENQNSRVKRYTKQRNHVDNAFLNLLKFYLNHSVFTSSSRKDRKGKTPREIMSRNKHSHWLELLGYERFKRKPA